MTQLGEAAVIAAILFLFASETSAESRVELPADALSDVMAVLEDECSLGGSGRTLLQGIIPERQLEESAQRAISALLEELRRKLWHLVNELKTEQWQLGEVASKPYSSPALIEKQYLRISLLCSLIVETVLDARVLLEQQLKKDDERQPDPSKKIRWEVWITKSSIRTARQ